MIVRWLWVFRKTSIIQKPTSKFFSVIGCAVAECAPARIRERSLRAFTHGVLDRRRPREDVEYLRRQTRGVCACAGIQCDSWTQELHHIASADTVLVHAPSSCTLLLLLLLLLLLVVVVVPVVVVL